MHQMGFATLFVNNLILIETTNYTLLYIEQKKIVINHVCQMLLNSRRKTQRIYIIDNY